MTLVVEQLNNLRLDYLDHGWVKAIYNSEFLEFGDLPPEYENAIEALDLQSTFKDIMKSTDLWLSQETASTEEKSWASLSHLIRHQKVLAILAYYIDHGCKNVLTKEYRNNAILASRVYYKLLSIPGYKAYQVYHSQLFAQSLACLSFPKAMCDEDNFFNTRELTREVNSAIQELRDFVIDLRAIIEHLQLTPSDMNFEDILSNLVDITGGAIVNKLHVDKIELTNISRVIYEIIDILICDANREPNAAALNCIFKCLLPKLIASSLDTRNAYNLVKASYVTYSGLLLSKYGKTALSGFTLMLEHLCYSSEGLERAEVRLGRVHLVGGLMSFLPNKSYRKIMKWIIRLSGTAKIPHRQLALEMLASLLNNDPDEPRPNENAPAQNDEIAANPNAEATAEPQPSTSQACENQPATGDQNEASQRVVAPTDDDNSQSSQDSQVVPLELDPDLTEEEVVGLLRQRPHTVPHAEILHAIYERVHDSSGTVRTRAITIMTECLTTDRAPLRKAIKELNGSGEASRLMAVGARSVCDEKAVVRRAGTALVQRLLADASAPPPQRSNLEILVNLCRDASIIVRSTAIAALGDLVSSRPNDAVFDAFLSGPMFQLSDPETKVQEQVLTLIQQLFLDRLRKFMGPGCEDPLPWMFLAAITRRKMKGHLQKACFKLKSANCINHRLVDILSTHLGALDDERDLHCLVLLTSVARLVDYSDIAFALDYYYSLADVEEIRDVRLMMLILELLTSWSAFMQSHERSALRDHLVRRLAADGDDGCRIACVSLACQLDPENLTWATELMQLSVRRAVERGDIMEAVRAADLSLIAPVSPSPALLRMFLNALSEPPLEWEEAKLGMCVVGAGRLSLRSRDVAAAAAPVLAALLPRANVPVNARTNALHVLTDICVRYTCIVEPLMESVCGCLSPESPADLRRTTAHALTRLLVGGYLRLRTPLYYRYCALLADINDDVREPAEHYVACGLTTDAIYHHFVDCVLYYNNDNTEINFDERQLIYDVMLQRMSLVQKLNIQCRLAREILEHAADLCDEGDEDLPLAINAALLDTISLLCGPRMKLPRKPQNNADANDIDDLQERITTNIVSHKMKRTVAEVLVPAVLRLYSRIGARGGQVATYLVRLATDLLNEYRQEIEELIENDEELVVRVQQFQETIGHELTFGNMRNLVTSTAPPEPETPRAPRRRPRATPDVRSPRKRALRI